MISITNDKYMQFVIDHYEQIQAMNELVEHTRKNLPPLVKTEIIEAILELEDNYFYEHNLKVEHDELGEQVFWYDPNIYSIQREVGPCFNFSYENFDWADLDVSDPEDAIELFLWIDVEDIEGNEAKDEYIDQWIEILETNESRLRKAGLISGYNVEGFDYIEPYLVTYPLYEEMKLETIKNREYFRQQIQEAVKTFTSALLPILRENRIT